MRVSKKKANVTPAPPDVQRDRILRFLAERHRSARGPAKIPIGIRDLQSALKKRHDMTQQEVSSNLDYLVQVGWVREVVKQRSFTTTGGMEVSQEQVKFKISDVGINHMQSATIYRRSEAGHQVNITNIKGVTVVGDGNVVNTHYTDLSRALDELDSSLAVDPHLSDGEKLEAAAEVATIKAQIAKQNPSRTVVKTAWQSLEGVATAAGVADAIAKVKGLIGPLLGG